MADNARIFEKSVNCVETLNGAAADVDAARFQWHIGGIASFQAIMHILSELRNPLFNAPDRQRALRALQMSRILRENNSAKAWQAVKNMIDKAVSEHNLSPRGPPQPSTTYVSQPIVPSIPMPLNNNASNSNTGVYPAMQGIPSYAYQNPSAAYNQQNMPGPSQPEPMQTQPDLLQSMQSMQDNAPCWDDINLNNINNIVGDVQASTDVIPDFDFVSNHDMIR
ncbi:hypothetical protein J4E89_006753 [Alternaria sp. Ai002NY15]|nr:hypothetical protein J4E89_006753 [Alternaria sp. Ai002NY15]